MKTLILIPARYGSIRLPGKPLKNDTGYPLIQHVYEQAQKSTVASRIIVATDDQRIQSVVAQFGGECVLTANTAASGSDRIAEVVKKLREPYDVIVNIQGDEPELEPEAIDQIAKLHYATQPYMSTLACRFPRGNATGTGTPYDPSCVKVVLGKKLQTHTIDINTYKPDIDAYKAIYFSRSVVPYPRDQETSTCNSDFYLHIGIYAYSRNTLLDFSERPKSRLESKEQLEQLRAIENDLSVHVGIVHAATPGVDTPEDYAAFVNRWKNRYR